MYRHLPVGEILSKKKSKEDEAAANRPSFETEAETVRTIKSFSCHEVGRCDRKTSGERQVAFVSACASVSVPGGRAGSGARKGRGHPSLGLTVVGVKKRHHFEQSFPSCGGDAKKRRRRLYGSVQFPSGLRSLRFGWVLSFFSSRRHATVRG